MEILTSGISFLLLVGLITSPFFIIWGLNKLNVKNRFIAYLVCGVVVTIPILLTLSWWSDYSNLILLSHYNYDFEAWNDPERFANVAAENMEQVKSLEMSMMGIGWPLKATR